MLLSVDQVNKNAYMLSLPRDLWVTYQDTCWVGNQGKLNAAYSCASDDGADEAAGAAALQGQVKSILGVDTQYYIHLNFTAVVEAVDAVGGVDVTIETPDPNGILDRNFDWKCNFKCYYVKYDQGEVAHLDGEHALALARARNAAGGYGLPGGNFDREKNQQKIIQALREKALSAGTLSNLGAVTGLIDALGNNLHTSVKTKEIRTLMSLASDINSADIVSLTLVDEDMPLVTTGSYNGQSIVRPVAGIDDFAAIQAYVKKNLTSDPVAREGANIVVLNGSGVAGVGQTEADKLTDAGFTVGLVDNAPAGTYASVEIYKVGEGNTATAAKLAERFGVTVKTTAPPVLGSAEADFVIIIGAPQE
jgi:LCP family protein required for cell wall assembly